MKVKVVVRDGEDGYYVAKCPAFEGCVTQGKTVEEALENIREAIKLWIDTCNDRIKAKKGEKVVEVII